MLGFPYARLTAVSHSAKNRVAVAMSGGVDSSVAALMLKHEGFVVVGFSARFLPEDTPGSCCSVPSLGAAKLVCDHLGIEHHVFDVSASFHEKVIRRFASEYHAGRTPNPCIDCNRFIKFGEFLRVADELDCAFLATGHYARIDIRPRETFGPVPKPPRDTPLDLRARVSELLQLRRGIDREKDQSYFLAAITRRQLPRVFFPVGEMTKDQVRALATEARLPTAMTRESQDACFVSGEFDIAYWVELVTGEKPRPGVIRDLAGEEIGEHPGIEYFTRGQRKGLRVGGGPPRFVADIDADDNALIVGERGEQRILAIELSEVNLLADGYVDASRPLMVRTRYRQEEVPATLHAPEDMKGGGEAPRQDARLTVRFAHPQEFVSPGQWCVFYDRELVVGCGCIQELR